MGLLEIPGSILLFLLISLLFGLDFSIITVCFLLLACFVFFRAALLLFLLLSQVLILTSLLLTTCLPPLSGFVFLMLSLHVRIGILPNVKSQLTVCGDVGRC